MSPRAFRRATPHEFAAPRRACAPWFHTWRLACSPRWLPDLRGSRGRTRPLARAARDRFQPRVDPRLDVRHHLLLADVGEQIVEVALVQLQRFVARPDPLVELLAAARARHLVGSAV